MCSLCKVSPPVQVCNSFAYKFYVFMLNKILNLSFLLQVRPGKSGGTWEPSSMKIFGLQENI